MLNKISFKNYKAFSEGEVKIRPITILLGANSVGKSSIMQLFLMLQQTALSEKNYKSALKLHGGFVSLGEGVNLIRKKDSTKTLTINIDFYSGRIFDAIKNEYFITFCQDFLYTASLIQRLYGKGRKHDRSSTFLGKLKNLFSSEEDLDIRFLQMSPKDIKENFDSETFYDLVNSTYDLISKVDVKDFPKELKERYYIYGTRGRIFGRGGSVNHFHNLKENKDEYILTFDFLNGIVNNVTKGHFNVDYEIMVSEKTLVLKKVTINNEQNELLSVQFEQVSSSDFKPESITSKYIDKEKFKPKHFQNVKGIFNNPRTIFDFVNAFSENERMKENQSVFASTIKYFINSVNSVASDYFENDNINYVSPLRAHPKRYYFLDKAKINAYVDTLDGDAIAETLKENFHLRKQVNDWLEKFNLKVDVKHLEDIIHKLQVNQNSLSLDITDVGFGISQVLPVIIQGFLSHENSLTLIEQPEIHLHPKMQADLADLFIDIVLKNKSKKNQEATKYLFIETHSEYLLKRLRRRISDGTILPENVAIYLIDPANGDEGGVIRELMVGEHGFFEWPIDFYGGELLKDTTEFIKNQTKK